MGVVNLAGIKVSENSYNRARQIVNKKLDSKEEGGRKTAADVLASIRNMKPDWVVDTRASAEWQQGARNLEIAPSVLERMAEDPEAMVRYKALILDLEELVPVIEEWKEENEGYNLEFRITLDGNGITRAKGIVRTLMGGEKRTTFELPTDGATSWADLIRQKLDALLEGQTEDEYGETSWVG